MHKNVLECVFVNPIRVFYMSNFVIILKQLFTAGSINIGE